MLSWQLSAGVAEFLISEEVPISLWTDSSEEVIEEAVAFYNFGYSPMNFFRYSLYLEI